MNKPAPKSKELKPAAPAPAPTPTPAPAQETPPAQPPAQDSSQAPAPAQETPPAQDPASFPPSAKAWPSPRGADPAPERFRVVTPIKLRPGEEPLAIGTELVVDDLGAAFDELRASGAIEPVQPEN